MRCGAVTVVPGLERRLRGSVLVRFDDMLATVLAQAAETPAARAALWRQLVDIAAQRRGADPELMAAAQARLRKLGAEMPETVRAQTARSLGGRDLPPAVVALFGEQPASIAAPVLGTARMAEADWLAILPGLPPSGRALLRHRRDLPAGVVRALEGFGPADFAIPGAVGVRIDHVPAEIAAEPIVAAPTEAFVAEAPAEIDGATQIRTLVARIEAFRRRRPPLPRTEPESAPPGGFRFETDADGVFRWVQDIARGCLIGETISTPGEGLHGVDGAVAGAHRRRAPFRDARLGIAGTGADAGEWRISAVPFFASADGRFLGYRGTGRRPRADESAARTMPSAGLFGSGMAADSLRQLVHELRTPINAISGFAEMIERQMLGPAGDAYRSRATDIVRQAERLIDAIDDLDVAARIETQRLGLAREPVDLAESRAVFLAGLGLPDAWAGRDRFTVGELGFGTGLNQLALLQLWRAHRPSPAARLHLVSVEAHPLAPADAARALQAWPELADLAAPLLAAWPRGRSGLHRFAWPALGATLDLMVGEALPAVEGWAGAADGWMLDGFAPSRNPDMWRPALLAAVAARSRPGARAATFTVAGVVRRGLEGAGFAVAKRPGHGSKRERLEARLPGDAPPDPPLPSVAVVGAGIAGAALARALRREGLAVTMVGAGEGASGNAAALVSPRLDAGLGPAAQLAAAAFAHAVGVYGSEAPEAVIARGALRLAAGARDGERFARVAASDLFDPGALEPADAPAVAATLGEADSATALKEADALVVEPAAVLRAWLGGAPCVAGEVAALAPDACGWRLLDGGGRELARAEVVVLAGGAAGARLLPGLELRPVRGQAETAAGVDPGPAAAWGGYAVPTRDGVLWGATHGRGDADVAPRPAERDANLLALAAVRPRLAATLRALPPGAVESRAGVRAATADHLPLAGPVPGAPGVWTLTGLGGRGFTWAPLLAEEVAARIAGAPPPLPLALARLVAPDRPRAAVAGTAPSRPRSPRTPDGTPS